MADITPPDFTSPVGMVRALIPDIEPLTNPNTPADPAEFIFSDGHLTALLAMSFGSPLLAGAMACEVLGTSETIIAKTITTQDLATDGPGLMKAYLARGAQLRTEALRQDNQEDYDVAASVFIFQPFYPASAESQMLGDPAYDGSYRPIWP